MGSVKTKNLKHLSVVIYDYMIRRLEIQVVKKAMACFVILMQISWNVNF